MAVRFRLEQVLKDKGLEDRPVTELAEEIGLNPTTFRRLRIGVVDRIDCTVLEKLMAFFKTSDFNEFLELVDER